MTATRKRFWRSYRPLAVGAVGYVLLLFAWQKLVIPRTPVNLRRDIVENRTQVLQPEGIDGPYNTSDDPAAAELLLLGDSRMGHDLVLATLEAAGLGRPAIIWKQGGQLTELLSMAGAFPARRLVVSLSPLSLYSEQVAGARDGEAELQDQRLTTLGIDLMLGTWFRTARARSVQVIGTRNWEDSWFYAPDPTRSSSGYTRRLRPATRAQRAQNIERCTDLLRGLREEGWEIVCIRLPISDHLLAVEDEAVPRATFAEMCQRAGVPFIDYLTQDYLTHDGSHLTHAEALRFSLKLAEDLAEGTSWDEP